jgi:PilZ domain
MHSEEQRQHFRIEDDIHFTYCIVNACDAMNEEAIHKQLLGHQGQKYQEVMQYFNQIDSQISEVEALIKQNQPDIAHYLLLLNNKIDHFARFILLENNTPAKKASLSLGGMAFDTNEKLEEKTHLKLCINTKPNYIPIIIDAKVVYCNCEQEGCYRIAIQFLSVNSEEERLLSQHIMHGQRQINPD